METKGPPIHVRFEGYANDWITETAKRNRISKPDLIRVIVSEKMEALGVRPPKKKIEYGAEPHIHKIITVSDMVQRSRDR